MARKTGKRALLELLRAEGLRYVFGNPGTTEEGLMDELAEFPDLEYMLGLHESVAVGMADGYARASGQTQFVNLHVAAGISNGLSMLYDAYRDGSPLVVTAGQSDSRLILREPQLSGDLAGLARQFTKWSYEVRHAADLPLAVRRAFKIAAQPPTGPVFLALPMDVLDETFDFELPPASRFFERVRPDPQGVERAVEALARAQKPVILAGDQVPKCGGNAELIALAERLGAPVYVVGGSWLDFPIGHPLFAGVLNTNIPAARERLAGHDVILAAGASIFTQFLYVDEPILSADQTLVHLDRDPWELGKNVPTTIGVLADLALGLAELTAGVTGAGFDAAAARARLETARGRQEERRSTFKKRVSAAWDRRPIASERLMGELKANVPENAIFVDESITSGAALSQTFEFGDPAAYFSSRGGAIGWGLPNALGVQLRHPDRRVIAVCGDGSSIYSIQSLWTAAHYRLPVIYVICNNSSYRILKLGLTTYRGELGPPSRFVGMDLVDPPVDFSRVAAGFGVAARRVEDPDELAGAIREAVDSNAPALLDVVIEKSLRR
ncbi:MAG: thiamine pyrophosphate-binding protein [Chloroflexi bacterium]|nr:thiamine pyrophosphate-binding protein [Chloroflexota bacterium]